MAGFDDAQFQRYVDGILSRWPTVGLAVGVVRDGELQFFRAHGLADIAANTPVTRDTVFRIASITKTFTGIAVMQLWERGLIDLDAPANEYLRAYRLVPARSSFGPVTVRHLLTHTSGIREVLHPTGLLRMRDLGETVQSGHHVPDLAEYYGGALRVDAEPGTRFAYTDHGFATLGQIVTDMSGHSLRRYLREHIFEPLGMNDTDLGMPAQALSRAATGYGVGRRGPKPVHDLTVVTVGGGGICSTPADMARYLAALLGGGANQHGSVLKPETLATMFAPQYQTDARVPGMGLAFFRTTVGEPPQGHIAVEHDGILPGFDSQIVVAPDDGVAVMAFATGAPRGLHWLAFETGGLLRQLLGVADSSDRAQVAHHPETWRELCGWYRFRSHPTDPAVFAIGAGAEVFVRRGRLMMRFLNPIPALYQGFPLHPDDAQDPYVFRIELPWFGDGNNSGRVVFTRNPDGDVTAMSFGFAPIALPKRPAATNPRRWALVATAGVVLATAAAVVWRKRRT